VYNYDGMTKPNWPDCYANGYVRLMARGNYATVISEQYTV